MRLAEHLPVAHVADVDGRAGLAEVVGRVDHVGRRVQRVVFHDFLGDVQVREQQYEE